MKTKESIVSVCRTTTGRDRKILIVFGIIVLLLVTFMAIASAFWKFYEVNNRENMMYGAGNEFGRGKIQTLKNKPNAISFRQNNDFVLPEDALKSGEIAIVVNNLENAKKEISNESINGGGNIYATFISYASDDIKNGSIIVQLPVENFDRVFTDLKKVGVQVVQESTRQIPLRSTYMMPIPMNTEVKNVPAQTTGEDVVSSNDVVDAGKDIAMYPAPPINTIQNKAYIRVVLVDYGKQQPRSGFMMNGQQSGDDAKRIGAGETENIRKNLLIIIGLKLVFVIAIFGLMLVLFTKILRRIRELKKEKNAVHVVRQMPRRRTRVIKTDKRK